MLTVVNLGELSTYPVTDGDHRLDGAVHAMIDAAREPDSHRRAEFHRVAQIQATLSLRDAVQELTAVIKERRG